MKSSRYYKSSEQLPTISTSVKTGKHMSLRKNGIINTPIIERSRKNLLLMKKMKQSQSSIDESDTEQIVEQLQSRKKNRIIHAELEIIRKNQDKKTYLNSQFVKQNLVGQEAIQKFYQRYKKLEKVKQKQQFFNEKYALTQIVLLLQIHNFTPRKLSLIKLRGEQAILDLKKLGIGQGSMGQVISEIVNFIDKFEEVDLSFNRIDHSLADTLIQKLGRVKIVNLGHNRIGKIGCQRLSELFLSNTTLIEELILQENSIIDNYGVYLLQFLPRYTNLRILDLSKNYLSTKFAQKMKEVLDKDRHLLELYLSWNEFTEKAVKNILDGVLNHAYLKVFDFSWNKIEGKENIEILCKILQSCENLIHLDVSQCSINLKYIPSISKSLLKNHSLYGLHFEGNSGYIDPCGFLKPTDKQFHEYPLPIVKGIVRRIQGVKPSGINQYLAGKKKDICWICSSWQQRKFKIDPKDVSQTILPKQSIKQVFIHFQFENYLANKMSCQTNGVYECERMCPIGQFSCFYTLSNGADILVPVTHPYENTTNEEKKLCFEVGPKLVQLLIKQRNLVHQEFEVEPVAQKSYQVKVKLKPRIKEGEIKLKNKITVKKKRIRQEKIEYQLKDLSMFQDQGFLNDHNNRDSHREYLAKCLDFDLQNSKIPKLLKDAQNLKHFREMALDFYTDFKDTFYYLAKTYPNIQSIFSISQLDFQRFLEEQRYVSKRVTHAKIMLKLYSSLAVGQEEDPKKPKEKKKNSNNQSKLISRPQFLQFLVRLAMEKWCYVPKKKPKEQKDKQEEKQEDENQTKKLKLPLHIIDGIERTLSTLTRYAEQYRSSNWRAQKYLKIDLLSILKSYEEFLSALFGKYAEGKSKIGKPKKLHGLMTMDQFKNIFIDSDLKRNKEAMKESELCFLDAKRLEFEDGQLQYGLNYDQFLQCLARYSQFLWVNPAASPNDQMWESQVNRFNTPLFLKFESIIIHLYNKFYDFHNRRLDQICQFGLFKQELPLLQQRIKDLQVQSRGNVLFKTNTLSMELQREQISLKSIIQQLKTKYDSMVVHKEEEYEEDAYVD